MKATGQAAAVASPAPAARLNESTSPALAVAPLVAAQIGGQGIAAAAVREHREHAEGAEGAAPSAEAAMAFAARAIAPASTVVTATAVNVLAAVAPPWPSQSSRGRQLKPTERKTNQEVPSMEISSIITGP